MDTERVDRETIEGFSRWVAEFEAKALARRAVGDPDWSAGARPGPAVIRSIQRFQVGESGDGAHLIAKAARAGDEEYRRATELFVAEERNHARLLEHLLAAAGAPTIDGHWSDALFVGLRRALGLRLELMVLTIAETVALTYYRVLRDRSTDPLTGQVAALILADERRHVPFHVQRLRVAFAGYPAPVGRAVVAVWWILHLCATVAVAVDHGAALRHLGCGRMDFIRSTAAQFAAVTPAVFPYGGRTRRSGLRVHSPSNGRTL